MNEELKNRAKEQLDRAVEMARSCVVNPDDNEFFARDFQKFLAYSRVAVAEIAGEQSSFSKQIEDIVSLDNYHSYTAECIVGVVEGVMAAIDSGLLEGYGKLTRGDLFSDYLDMARYLLDEGYKDAAAVIAGSSLEVHLRYLCETNDIPITVQQDGKDHPRKADSLNAELRKQGCYGKTELKAVIGWLGIRNDAAHGDYDEYTAQAIRSMIMGVQGFISNHL